MKTKQETKTRKARTPARNTRMLTIRLEEKQKLELVRLSRLFGARGNYSATVRALIDQATTTPATGR